MILRLITAFAAALIVSGAAAPAQDEATRPVKLITIEDQSFATERVFFGRVVAKETVDLAFQVNGQVLSIPLTQGELVPAGTLVARLDLEPFELALEQAELQKAQADRTVERYDQLTGSTVSRVVREDAQTAAALADVALRNARVDLEHASLYAPFDAIVAERLVANFTTVSPGMPVVSLHDMSVLRIEIDVPEVLFQRACYDTEIEITAEFPASDGVFPVELREFRAASSEIGQTYRVTLGMTPQPGLDLLPGASATVRSRIGADVTPPIIPASAIAIANGGATSVYVFEPEGADGTGILRQHPVTVEPAERGGMRVTSGLDVGTQIVATGLGNLADGMRARRFTGFPE